MVKSVKIYSTPTCPYCRMAKDFLKQNNVEFTDIDVSFDETAGQEMVNKSGQIGVPQLEIDGEIIVGFDKAAIKRALDLA